MTDFADLNFSQLISFTGYAVETVGVFVIVIGSIWATIHVLSGKRKENHTGVTSHAPCCWAWSFWLPGTLSAPSSSPIQSRLSRAWAWSH